MKNVFRYQEIEILEMLNAVLEFHDVAVDDGDGCPVLFCLPPPRPIFSKNIHFILVYGSTKARTCN